MSKSVTVHEGNALTSEAQAIQNLVDGGYIELCGPDECAVPLSMLPFEEWPESKNCKDVTRPVMRYRLTEKGRRAAEALQKRGEE